MLISGLQKTTLLDYPGHLAATIFLGGCNFRCPFCHNRDLLEGNGAAAYSEEEILAFFSKRSRILEGVCITGGEPTLQADLADFIQKLRQFGLKIKLDTNGYQPRLLTALCQRGLIDYVAMDIKSGPSGYKTAAGWPDLDLTRIEQSISFLLKGSVPYEFRTTVVRGLHQATDFEEIGPWISGAERYFLQSYQDSEQVLCRGFSSFHKEELLRFAAVVSPHVPSVSLRGVD